MKLKQALIALVAMLALVIPFVAAPVATPSASAALGYPCHAIFLGPTFTPNGGIAWCSGESGTFAADHIRVMLKCQTDTAWRYGPAVYINNQTSGLYCPPGRLALQVSIALYA